MILTLRRIKMSNSNHVKQDTESMHLSKHLKEEIPVEELTDSS